MDTITTLKPYHGLLPHSVKLYPVVQLLPESPFPNSQQWPIAGIHSNLKFLKDNANTETVNNQIYVHVPFCPFICHFCPLYKVKEKRLNSLEVKERYVQSLISEIEMYSRSPSVTGKIYNTIYFGGGTPTELTAAQINRIITALKQKFVISQDAEITLEGVARQMDNPQYLKDCFTYGINRISFGVQSLNESIRKVIGRGDQINEYKTLIEKVRSINPDVVLNVEIMACLPSQTFDMFCFDIDQIISWNVNSLDVLYYVMMPDTKLYNRINENKVKGPKYGTEMMKFREYANKELQAKGYVMQTGEVFVKNERDLFTKTSFPSENTDSTVLALGPSSFGILNNTVYQNVCNLEKYINVIEENKFPVSKRKTLTVRDLNHRKLLFTILKLGPVPEELINGTRIRKLVSLWEKKELVKKMDSDYVFTELGKLWYNHMQIDLLSLQEKLQLLNFFGSKDTIVKMYTKEKAKNGGPIIELLNLIRDKSFNGEIRYYLFLAYIKLSAFFNFGHGELVTYLGKIKK